MATDSAMTYRRSYDLKVDRAEKHLIDLEYEIRRYVRSHPYLVRKGVEGKREIHRLHIRQPDDEVALIAGDFLYNIHSALNHLAVALVPSNNRSSVDFPIFWQGVWEDPVEGENKQRLKDRRRWATYTREMAYEAVAILQRNQPQDLGTKVDNTQALAMLKRLRNRDAHKKLMVIASALLHSEMQRRAPGGAIEVFRDPSFRDDEGLPDGAELTGIPEGAVDVKVTGTPKVLLCVGQLEGGFMVEKVFRDLLDGTRNMIELLRPYDRL